MWGTKQVIGREKEIARVVQVLARKRKNNPILLGEPGVGKTAIAEGLARAIVSGEEPSNPNCILKPYNGACHQPDTTLPMRKLHCCCKTWICPHCSFVGGLK